MLVCCFSDSLTRVKQGLSMAYLFKKHLKETTLIYLRRFVDSKNQHYITSVLTLSKPLGIPFLERILKI